MFLIATDQPLDIAFLVDCSSYTTDEKWKFILSFLQNAIDQLRILPGTKGNHLALVTYSSSALAVYDFNGSQNVTDIKKIIGTMKRRAGYRRPDEALKLASSSIFTPGSGARDSAKKVI